MKAFETFAGCGGLALGLKAAGAELVLANELSEDASKTFALNIMGSSDGVITVEEGKALDSELDTVMGMNFDRGYLSQHFVTDAEKMIAELEDAYILIYD